MLSASAVYAALFLLSGVATASIEQFLILQGAAGAS
jgi:hypothetical protein